jgi:DNA-binding CsgD family transcriptional regulator
MMSPKERELHLRVADGNPDALPFLYTFHSFVRCQEILSWLIEHRITGERFLEWIIKEHDKRVLSAGAFVLSKLEKEKTLKPVLAGRDFKIV